MKQLTQTSFNHCTILHYFKNNSKSQKEKVQQMRFHTDNIYRKDTFSQVYEFSGSHDSQTPNTPTVVLTVGDRQTITMLETDPTGKTK